MCCQAWDRYDSSTASPLTELRPNWSHRPPASAPPPPPTPGPWSARALFWENSGIAGGPCTIEKRFGSQAAPGLMPSSTTFYLSDFRKVTSTGWTSCLSAVNETSNICCSQYMGLGLSVSEMPRLGHMTLRFYLKYSQFRLGWRCPSCSWTVGTWMSCCLFQGELSSMWEFLV